MRHLLYWARSGGLGLLLALFFLAPAWGKDTTISDGDPNGAKTPYRIGDIVTDDTIDMYGNVHGSNRYSTNAEARYNTLTFDWRDGKPPILVGGYNDWFSQGCGGQGPGDVPVCHNPADGYVMTDTFSANDLLVSLIGWDSMTTNEAYSNFTNIYNLGPGGSIAGSVFGGLANSGTGHIRGMIFTFDDEWTGEAHDNTINIKPPAGGTVEIMGGVFGGIVLERAGLEGDEKIGDILAKVVSKAAVKILAGP
ncbi:MAG: hypothetical protein LBP55_02900, partial [Candidatus Adiutrix sp.]|nr:hypothetical protein [Candidatus Adiutrix sp.]